MAYTFEFVFKFGMITGLLIATLYWLFIFWLWKRMKERIKRREEIRAEMREQLKQEIKSEILKGIKRRK